jgi:hypothetical protein
VSGAALLLAFPRQPCYKHTGESMGENTVRHAAWLGPRRIAGAAAALAMAAIPQGAAAQKAPPARDSGARAAIVEFEEARGSRVIYFEESGGMARGSAKPPAKEAADPPKKPAAKPMPRPAMNRIAAAPDAKP